MINSECGELCKDAQEKWVSAACQIAFWLSHFMQDCHLRLK